MPDSSPSTVVAGVTDAQRETIEKLYRGVAGEYDLLDEAVTPAWIDIPAAPGQAPGPDGVKPHFKHFHENFRDVSIVLHEMIGVDGHVAVRGEIKGTHVGEWKGVPGTDKECVIAIHEFHHFDGDRLGASWHMEDWLGWLRQVGGDPTKLA